MKRIYFFTFLIFLLVSCKHDIDVIKSDSREHKEAEKLSLTLQVKNLENKLPAASDDWFTVEFICTVKNNSSDTIYFVHPVAYKIFPHPWTICINGEDAGFWSGDIMCAPAFSKEDILCLPPRQAMTVSFDWHEFVSNFTKRIGTYQAKIKYNFIGSKTSTMGVSDSILTDLQSGFSNSVTFKIIN